MTDLNELLKAGDPAAHEPPLPLVDVQRMRRVISSASGASTRDIQPRAWWPQPIAVAAALALTIAAAVGLGRQLPGNRDQAATEGGTDRARFASSGDSEGTTRQLHFETPGGTQIIWVFDEGFKL